jgi:hypothetical protein
MSEQARIHHERSAAIKSALEKLRRGDCLTDQSWKKEFPGSRVAPVIDKLRNAYGFNILGEGSLSKPHYLDNVYQMPTMVMVTPEIKEMYYASEHWEAMRAARMERDGQVCLLCSDDGEQVHHIRYRLFNEEISDLMTVCRECHEKIHESSRLKFPSGISVDGCVRLGISPVFEDWLMAMREYLF